MATTENARLIEVQIERARERGIAGSIYKGRVNRVLPGMQAAFIDIGLVKAAFLPGADLIPRSAEEYALQSGEFDPAHNGGSPARAILNEPLEPASPALPADRIEDRLRKGDDVLLQISKEPIGTKGARVTSNISLPGRYLVSLPLSRNIGVSRRIEGEEERQRLREAVESVGSTAGGIIVRTACEGISKREIQADLRLLRKLWQRLSRRAETLPAPALLHSDLDLILRTVRDLSASDVTRVLVDNRRDYQRIVDFIESVMPRTRLRIDLYEHPEPIFDRYGIESQIAKALERKVWLKSGGHIIIDQTEALTAIDVNTGRFVGRSDLRETTLRTNLEAARVIIDQLRLRNIGGLIVIDFIDMESAEDRKAVLAAVTDALRSDKARATILGISDLGLVEMTRQRSRESLQQRLCEPCPTCTSKGYVKGTATTAYEVLRRVRREAVMNGPLQQVVVHLHPTVAAYLAQEEPAALRELERELEIEVLLSHTSSDAPHEYRVTAVASVPGAS